MAAFDEWTQLEEHERGPWLERMAASTPALHGRVTALIRADAAAADAFLRPAVEPRTVDGGLEGRRLGPWLIERLIGAGGMGHVWLARRTDGLYDGLAAIKLMRLASMDRGADQRFASEGRLLGRLSHPNIARLLDAGVTPAGERYLVLEYVEGERIDRWCDRQRLTIDQRLSLFVDVCKAVTHAHENLVVHRDLKPSNIFVTVDGDVKLLDFGVATLIESDGAARGSDLTREAGTALTPDYAAPEQLAGGPISTATDVYGLGLVLFGLLSGLRPPAASSPAASSLHARSASAATGSARTTRSLGDLSSDAAETERIAAARRTTVPALRRVLRGDLGVVVGKAIKADPGERYGGVAEFAADLERVVRREPIAARPDSVAYRAHRYVQRHAFGVVAAALVAASIGAGIAGTLLKEREAKREAERAVAVKRFLLDLFDQARNTVQSGGLQVRATTVNDLLAAGADRVERSFASQPEIRDEVFEVVEGLYSDAFEPQAALALARRRLAAAQSAFGPGDPRVAPAETGLASALIIAGELPAARDALARSEALLDGAGDETSIARARLLRWQGIVILLTGAKTTWHEHPLRRSVELLRARYADDDELLEALVSLPSEACRLGEPAEAVAAAEELDRRTLARHGPDNLFIDTATLLRGQLLLKTGRAGDAVPFLERARDGFLRHLRADNQNVLLAELELSEAASMLGDPDGADRSFAAAEHAMQHDHPGDPAVASMVESTREDLARLKAGETPRRCAP